MVGWPYRWWTAAELETAIRQYVRYHNQEVTDREPLPMPSDEEMASAVGAVVTLDAEYFGVRRYHGIYELSAAAMWTLAKGQHTFVNGNKRIATYVMLFGLRLNGISIRASDWELAEFAKAIAKSNPKHRVRTIREIQDFIFDAALAHDLWDTD